MVEFFYNLRWQDVFDILIVAFLIYQVLLIIRGTRAFQILLGLFLVFIIYGASNYLGLYTLHWILNGFLSSIVLIIIVLFQNEIRRALAKAGKTSFARNPLEEERYIEETIKACVTMSLKRIGALLVFARENKMPAIVEGGVLIDGHITDNLLVSIFNPASPIHDGAVVINDGRVLAAGCFLPLTSSLLVDKHYGTRHRAAVGITEETDAVVIVVSEETGDISLAMGGKLTRSQDADSLRRILKRLFGPRQRARGTFNFQSWREMFRSR
ncbi:MAG: diadenylate cyclase CdaA [Deltaproteobacteria bacterium]|nr:diadenylate cyclase CdaA [Candidatus Anaeroferrophillacea bacterium]